MLDRDHGEIRQHGSHDCREKSNDQGLGEKLPSDAASAGAERRAYAGFRLPLAHVYQP